MSRGIQPEIFPQYGDLGEYLQAIVTRHLSGDGYTSEDDNDMGFDQAHLDRATLLSFIDAQNLHVAPQSTPVQAVVEDNNWSGNLSRNTSLDSELDAAIALSLEEVEESDDSSTEEATPTEPFEPVIAEDDIDPDYMTFEQLQAQEEAVGTESCGLSKEILDSFPVQTVKAKSGWFSPNKTDPEGCPICMTEYEVDNELLTLPCLHLYHKSCIEEWLKENKTCPICNTDISVSQD